ncbi:MAG: pirin family protein, partial [Bdellovibrionales bacterium]|nr:pirin family protein [Bdellovibrionales bacterium]
MITIRKSEERGHANHGWLDTYHTFSFADYRDPEHLMFRKLRVMNEDRIAPNNGFGTHPHDNMEIITYVISGELEHRDSMGNGSIIKAGEFQLMSAGTGITHSERNPSRDIETHLYQMWVFPEERGLTPSYSQKSFAAAQNQIQLVASREAGNGSLPIHQDMKLYLCRLENGGQIELPLAESRYGWIQAISGDFLLNGQRLSAGDGAAVREL